MAMNPPRVLLTSDEVAVIAYGHRPDRELDEAEVCLAVINVLLDLGFERVSCEAKDVEKS